MCYVELRRSGIDTFSLDDVRFSKYAIKRKSSARAYSEFRYSRANPISNLSIIRGFKRVVCFLKRRCIPLKIQVVKLMMGTRGNICVRLNVPGSIRLNMMLCMISLAKNCRFYNWQVGIVIDDERHAKRLWALVTKTELLLTGAESLREQGFKRSEQT